MASMHLVDLELVPMIAEGDVLKLSVHGLADARALLPQFYLPFGSSPAQITQHHAPSLHGGPEVGVVIHSPEGTELRPAIFYIHGGGMVLGDAKMRQGIDGARALRWNTVIVSIEYRLAPETPFPGPIEDCYAGLVWLFANAVALGIDADRIAIMGDSAGGGLAASLAQLSRDRGGPIVCAQFLVYPMLDYRTGSEADPYRNAVAGEFAWTPSDNQFGWNALRGDYAPSDERKGHFSAILASDLTNLPPAALFVGALDLFVDETQAYAQGLARSGNSMSINIYDGAIHGFDIMAETQIAKKFELDLDWAIDRLVLKSR
jgi:acetyl esterase/lipase